MSEQHSPKCQDEFLSDTLMLQILSPESVTLCLAGSPQSCSALLPIAKSSYSLTVSALLLWRSITFIFPIIAAGLTTAFYRASPKEEVTKRGDIPNRQTFVNLQNETYVMRKEEVEALVNTTKLSRQAILAKLKPNPDKAKKKKKKTGNDSNMPQSMKDQDYETVDIKDEDDSI